MTAEFTLVGTSSIDGTALYEATWTEDDYWTGYLLPDTGQTPPETISYTDSIRSVLKQGAWRAVYNGFYLFAPTRPPLESDPETFINEITAYLDSQKLEPDYQAILWIPTVDPVSFADPFKNFSIVFTCDVFTGKFSVISNLNAAIGANLTFNVLNNTSLQYDTTTETLKLFVPVDYSQSLAFQRQSTNLGITVTGDVKYIYTYLPFTGNNTGCFLFSASITPDVTFASNGLPPGFQYVATEASNNSKQTVNTDFFFPALSPTELPEKLSCTGSVDLLDPFNQLIPPSRLSTGVLRSGFVLESGVFLPSCFRNSDGNQINLRPLGDENGSPTQVPLNSGALAFSTNAFVPSDSQTAIPSLTLTGQFAVTATNLDAGSPTDILCGIFGSEKISIVTYDDSQDANDVLLFCLASAAYAPVFPFATASLTAPSSGNVVIPLNSNRYTAWVTVIQGSSVAPAYNAEPAGNPMFGFPEKTADGTIILESQPPSIALPQGRDHAIPMVPYSGITATNPSGSTLASFESSILAATRKQIVSAGSNETWTARANCSARAYQARRDRLAGLASEETPPEMVYRTTPQGFIVTIDKETGSYQSIILGQTEDANGTSLPFGFQFPSTRLQDALQTNQLFLVIVNPENLVPSIEDFENVLDIEGWTMTAQVGEGVSATSYANVMVLKYCDGSFKDRISNPNQWSSQRYFSLPEGTDPDSNTASVCYTGLSSWLQDLVGTAETAVAADSESPYANFVDLINDPDWNGVLVLNANLDASSLPSGLAGIVAGIDLTHFTAHHFGFTASKVTTNSDKTISFNGFSSTFGLIDYTNQTFAANLAMGLSADTPINLQIPDNYAFSVLQLQVLFKNTAIQSFVSYLELGAAKLFGTEVLETTFGGARMPNNGVVLDGSYIDQNGTGVYIFVQSTPTIFNMNSNLLRAVAFNRVQFNCMGEINDGATTLNRFLIWGNFDFAALNDIDGMPLDILSFGDPASDSQTPASGAGLSFSSLLINMTFPSTTPNAVTFVEDTQNLSYDLSRSLFRSESLFKGLGLELSSFISASEEQTPADFGFLTVSAPLNLTSLKGPWHGVTYNITMGGPGALAANVGFNSTLLVAWSTDSTVDDSNYSLFMGLSLPGTAPGGKIISLQGVFKLSVDSLDLSRQQVPGSDPAAYYYCLKLNNIGLKILGIAKLPPDATINFFLFGDPGSTAGLGWYAAYNPNSSQSTALSSAPLLQHSTAIPEELND